MTLGSWTASAGRVLQTLGVNSIPVVGVFYADWSTGTALALYWIESLLATLLIAVRIVVHRSLTRKAGHWNAKPMAVPDTDVPGKAKRRPARGTLLTSFLSVMLIFTLAHGVFLAVLLGWVLPERGGPSAGVSRADLRQGVTGLALWLGAGLVMDLVGIGSRSFRWIEGLTQRAMSRVLVVHLTIIFGMGAVALTGASLALFIVFATLKTLVDLGGALPEQDAPAEPPPRWARALDRMGRTPRGEMFSDYWRRATEEERREREANEKPLPLKGGST